LRILSIDHRVPLIELAERIAVPQERLAPFKALVVDVCLAVADGRPGFGMFLDGGHGAAALDKAIAAGLWTARPVDKPHARPLAFEETGDPGVDLERWPSRASVKCAVYLHPDDPADILSGADDALRRLDAACRAHRRQLVLEALSSPHGPVDATTVAGLMRRIYGLGVAPDWWVIEDQPAPDGWTRVGDAVRAHDPECRGILTIARSLGSFPAVVAAARREPLVTGFCAGRSMFGGAIEPWLVGRVGDAEATREIAQRFAAAVDMWDGR
jgi:5-dehydro-2-deoxygluconokinase